jgi:transposase-like protein
MPRRKQPTIPDALHIALGVRANGTKDVLGLWIEQNEGAKFCCE